MITIKAEMFAFAYEELLSKLLYAPQYVTSPRGHKCYENIDVVLEIENPQYNLYENEARSSQKKYIAAELLWYFGGTNKTTDISDYASFWKQIENSDSTVNSAYGYLLFTEKNIHGKNEWTHAVESLLKDKDTRQATVRFSKPNQLYDGNKDHACTMYAVFHIREDKLKMTTHMRSNDAILGLPTDFAFFTTLQQQMLTHVNDVYPNVKLGSYTHVVDSMHIYERHFELVKNMLKSDFYSDAITTDGIVNLIDSKGCMTSAMHVANTSFLSKTTVDFPNTLSQLTRFIEKHINT